MQHLTRRAAALAAVATFGIAGGLTAPAAAQGKSDAAPGTAVAAAQPAASGRDTAPGQTGEAHFQGQGQGNAHGQGQGQPARPAPAWTEDNDTNDGGTPNNVPDEGDNRHPSGKDRSVEPGGSGNQGASQSDPNDDGRGPDRSNGGPDKPNGSGGIDLADQDGNNGCGNDDDFEDDNEGWCGRNPKRANVTPPPAPETSDADGTGGGSVAGTTSSDEGEPVVVTVAASGTMGTCPDGMVTGPFGADGCVVARGQSVPVAAPAVAEVEGEVLSSSAVAPAEDVATVSARSAGTVLAAVMGGGVLALTGADPLALLVVAVLLVAVGSGLLRTTRRRARA